MSPRKPKPRICLMDVESTSLDADVGVFVGGGLMELNGRFQWFYARTPRNEERALKSLLEAISKCDVLITWNGRLFDIPFLTARALKLKLPVENLYEPAHVDLAELVKSSLKLVRSDLYHVARFLGVKKDLSIEGFDVPSLYLKAAKGDKKAASAIRKHCKDDLEVTRRILERVLPLLRIKYRDLPL